jgi:FkbM family methyltransferase
MKRLAPVILIPSLVARRFLPAMFVVRALYRAPPLRWCQRWITFLFDPNSIRKHTSLRIPSRYVCVTGVLGERLRVNLGDHIGWNIFLNGYFDLVPSLLALVLHRAKAGGVYLDIGANIGDTSLAVAIRGIDTVGIDASAMAISELCHNVALNSPVPYTAVHAAVCSQGAERKGDIAADYIKLHVPAGNTGAASVHAGWNPSRAVGSAYLAYPRSVSEIVDSLSIHSLCCIKLDVEGAEHEALRGMQRLLETQHCPIVFEYRLDRITEVQDSSHNILDLLPEGYVCFVISCEQVQGQSAKLKITAFDPVHSYENVLAVYRRLPDELQTACAAEGMHVRFD